MRGQGTVYQPIRQGRKSLVWWLDFGIRGVRHRESSGTTSKRDAMALLRERIGKRTDGTLTGRPERVTLADLKRGLEKSYVAEGRTSWGRALQAFVHLESFFKADAKVLTITKSSVADYQAERIEAGAARCTCRYEVAILSAAFGVAVANELLAVKPSFKLVATGAARTGFFEPGEFTLLSVELPGDIADLVRFLYFSGWRKGEGSGLTWSQVDWDDATYQEEDREPIPGPNACFRIGEAQTKGRKAREFPITDFAELRELLLARWRVRDGLRVFHRHGKPVGDFRKVWGTACTRAGIPGRIVHDLRRTAARNLQDDGYSEAEIMLLCGWATRSVFDRYNVRRVDDLRRAHKRRAEHYDNLTTTKEQKEAVFVEEEKSKSL